MPSTLSPTTLKREVTARLPAFGSLKRSSSVIKKVVCSQFLFLNVLPKISINSSFTFYHEKTKRVLIYLLWSILCERQSTSEQILVQSPYPSVHTSLQSLQNQKPSLFLEDNLMHRNSVIPTSCLLVSFLKSCYVMFYRKHRSRCWRKVNEPPTESWQVQ